jgi:predicted N-acetyltransferase YhbS
MRIRAAEKWDQPEVFRMLRNFRSATPVAIMNECDNEEHISRLFHAALIGGGVCLLAERDGQVQGMIMGLIDISLWDPNLLVLKELVYWVEPSARGSTLGYRLLTEYNRRARELVEEGRIRMYTMTRMANSPDLDYGRFGYAKIEETWAAGA